MAVTQKTAERSYREHIEQQIQTYQRRCGPSHGGLQILVATAPRVPMPHMAQCIPPQGLHSVRSVTGNCSFMAPTLMLGLLSTACSLWLAGRT